MNKVDHKKLEVIDGITYLVSGIPFISQKKTPYTGISEGTWSKTGGQFCYTVYKDGKEQGESKLWHGNGNQMSITNWKDGELHGLAKWWYINGKKKNEISWKDGKIISAQVWQPDGVQCSESHITDGSGVIVYYKELWDISDRVEVAYRDIIENGNKV